MNFLRLLILLGIAGGAYAYWKQHPEGANQASVSGASSQTGFADLPPVEGHEARKVFVIAAENCPHEEAQRADRLAEDLSRRGIPVERRHDVRFNFSTPPERDTMDRLSRIMNGPLPIVFVNGRAKSNPSLEEVTAEFKGRGS